MSLVRVLALLLLFAGTDLTTACAERLVTDQTGRQVRVPDDPRRVVALAPSMTEIVFSLGQQDRLVGVTQYSTYPEAARDITRVGSYVRPDIERIVSLGPDLCLAIKEGNPIHAIRRIEAAGIPVYAVDPRDLQGIMTTFSEIGTLLKAEDEARVVVAGMQQRLDAVRQRVGEVAQPPAVFFQVDASPIISAGHDTFTDELIRVAGGRNLAAVAKGYPRYSWEDALRFQPEVVLVTSMSGGHSPEELLGQWRQWPQVPAVRDGRVHVVDASIYDRPTARLFDGLEQLAELLHPRAASETGGGTAASGTVPGPEQAR